MIRHPAVTLPDDVLAQFKQWQDEIDLAADYAARVALAKSTWNKGSFKKKAAFVAMRKALLELTNGVQRCAYCEDSRGNQVEHIRPKDWFPGHVFDTSNYVMACGDCNSPKNNHYAVRIPGESEPLELKRKRNDPVVEPPTGEDVLINPRVDDPFAFLKLNILTPSGEPGTFKFVEQGTGFNRKRAKYTITLLRLNLREELVEARSVALEGFLMALTGYREMKQRGDSAAKLNRARKALVKMPHQTVLEELKRQRDNFEELDAIFSDCPELL